MAPCSFIVADWFFTGVYCFHHHPNYGGSTYLWTGRLLWDYMTPYPRRLLSSKELIFLVITFILYYLKTGKIYFIFYYMTAGLHILCFSSGAYIQFYFTSEFVVLTIHCWQVSSKRENAISYELVSCPFHHSSLYWLFCLFSILKLLWISYRIPYCSTTEVLI
jgi:hypothetical protein